MESLQFLLHGFEIAMTSDNLLIALIGCLLGTIIGMLPGLGPINGVALLLPFAFALNLPAASALILLSSVYMGCEYGGRISAILMNVPGDAGALMTTIDGYPLAQQGKGAIALSISAVSSFIGAFIATIGIVIFAPILSTLAVSFGPAQYFALIIFAVVAITSLFGVKPIASIFATLIGVFISIIGIDAVTGVYRFTFNSVHLYDGVHFATLIIGLFSISEILILLEKTEVGNKIISQGKRKIFNYKEFTFAFWTMIRSSLVGFFIGVLPGAGASIASAVTYSSEKKIANNSSQFGNGDIRGIAAPEAANNASACGSFIPMLTLGVPGSGTTAVMLGALTLYNITPGPQLFSTEPDLVWGLIASLFIANIILLIINLPLVGFISKLLNVPKYMLIPIMFIASVVGVWSINSSGYELMIMMIIGLFGYILRKLNIPLPPLILGFVLGHMLETELRRALSISGGNLGVLFDGPITITLWLVSIIMLIIPFYKKFKGRNKTKSK